MVIGDSVEIGANCAIDRGALEDTVIGDGCKLDNLIQVAHNVRIGEGTRIAGCVGIAGSAIIGQRCRIGGGAGILGHLEICDDVTISAMSLVTRSIGQPGFYSGVFPLMDNAGMGKVGSAARQLPQWRRRLRRLERTDRKARMTVLDIRAILETLPHRLPDAAGRSGARTRDGQAHRRDQERVDQRAVLHRAFPATCR